MNTTGLLSLGITAAFLFAAWKYGNAEMKGMALGAAGFIVLNQIPTVRDGASVRLIA